MDKKTIIGFVLMAVVLIGYMQYEQKQQEKYRAEQKKNLVIQQHVEQEEQKKKQELQAREDSIMSDSSSIFFALQDNPAGKTVIENQLLKVTIDNKGGQICKAELKDSTYKSRYGGQVCLFDEGDSHMQMLFEGKGDENLVTDKWNFTPTDVTPNSVTMRLALGKGSLDIRYSLTEDSYLLNMDVRANNLSGFFSPKTDSFDIIWNEHMIQQEKGFSFENRYSTVTYRTCDDDTDELSSMGADEDEEEFDDAMQWVAFKTQFFSQVLIADRNFKAEHMTSKMDKENTDGTGVSYLKTLSARLQANFDPTGNDATNLKMYLGPNKFSTLKANEDMLQSDKDLDLQSLVYLGWPLIRYINRFFMLYLFDFMTGWGINMGIVLLLLTLIIKFAVYPLMKKSYLSSAKMRVLKPKIDEIAKKYPNKEDAMQKQQETMQLYSQYGVSPMGGCLPMLIQMPIWIALFNFIPNAIELRGQSFLWADDLSTYDDIINWGFNIWGIGDHLSLFCILWCLSTVANTWFTMRQQQDTMSAEQASQMKMMRYFSYFMPLIFFFSFNSYSSGLNYYYFISGLISIIMMWYMRKTTDEKKLLAGLEARYKERKQNSSGINKAGSMMERLQAMAEKQQQMRQMQEEQRKKK